MKKVTITPPQQLVFLITVMLFLFPNKILSQDKQSYYIRINENVNLGTIQKTVNADETLTLSTANTSFSNFLNNKGIYEFKQTFPGADTSSLQRVYTVTMAVNEPYTDVLQRAEVQELEIINDGFALIEEPTTNTQVSLIGPSTSVSANYPNDYIEVVLENLPNTALEQMKARFAWKITKGSPDVLVGLADGPVDYTHEDLQGIAVGDEHYGGTINTAGGHGTAVASILAANTSNNIGISSIGYNTKIYSIGTHGGYVQLNEAVWFISQVPGVKVINCSFARSGFSSFYEEMYSNIAHRGILVVCGAGNDPDDVLRYPAAYDSTLSVTVTGSRYAQDYYHNYTNIIWGRAWRDVFNQRPIDQPTTNHSTANEKVDVTAPAYSVISATNQYSNYPSGYRLQTTTSAATPLVSGLASLVFAANPNLTGDQVKDIIRNTADDIYYIPHNQSFIGRLGTGRVNAFRAVKTAKCMDEFTPGLDLAMQNTAPDLFDEPDVVSEYFWNSNDIWIRNQNDGQFIDTHQNPEYNANGVNYAYVRVTNNSCVTSSGTDDLKLYWSKANTALTWPLHWEGNFTITDPVTGTPILMGDEIGTMDIPILEPGQSKIIEFPWQVPNPDDFININDNPWHFCLLARIETPNDPMTFVEGTGITQNVKNNNNIAWKNTTVVDIIPGLITDVRGAVAVGNPTNTQRAFNLELHSDQNEFGNPLYQEAEIGIELDTVIYDAWVSGNSEENNFKQTKNPRIKIVNDSVALLNNIILPANTTGTITMSFNFLTQEQTSKRLFKYHVVQKDATTNEVIGGETYEIRRQLRPIFTADAGADEEAERDETITITAAQINEAATYNWYDPEGNLIHTGTDLTITATMTKKYKLEIVSNTDGYKDYDEIEVTVNPYKLESIAPNPASNQVTISYDAVGANSAYLMILDVANGTSNNYILNATQTTTTLDISWYQTGFYSITLVCDGEIQNSKTLAKQ
jgi:subtilisin family serine protease